ncbi:MAG: hypothetical protein AAF587_40140 [Bacteroidota bacterium]
MKHLLDQAIWKQILLIFIPLWMVLLGQVALLFGLTIPFLNRPFASIALVLILMVLIFGWQYYLGLSYLRQVQKSSLPFRINGAIPLLFWGILLGWLMIEGLSHLFQIQNNLVNPQFPGMNPMISQMIGGFSLYSLICLLINPFLIGRIHDKLITDAKIEEIGQTTEGALAQLQGFKKKYLAPLKALSRSLLIILGLLVLSVFFFDLARLLV